MERTEVGDHDFAIEVAIAFVKAVKSQHSADVEEDGMDFGQKSDHRDAEHASGRQNSDEAAERLKNHRICMSCIDHAAKFRRTYQRVVQDVFL